MTLLESWDLKGRNSCHGQSRILFDMLMQTAAVYYLVVVCLNFIYFLNRVYDDVQLCGHHIMYMNLLRMYVWFSTYECNSFIKS